MSDKNPITKWLSQANPVFFSLFAIIAAFCTYSCMYAFRKPFTAAAFEDGPELIGLKYKSVLVITQVIGYMLSKFIGIKVVSEMKPHQRALAIVALVGIAEVALLGFAVVPAPYNLAFLFINGLPLGMVWGLVFSYLEGRKYTEVMGLGLCASFIFASGFVKDIGRYLMDNGVSEYWMPFTTGLVFAIPLVFFVYLLSKIPDPNEEDISLRTKREPMTGKQRIELFKRFAPGLILLTFVYTLLTAYRDFRDNFMADIWNEIRGAGHELDFSSTELPISIGTLLVLMFIVLIKNNHRALMINHVAIILGILMVGFSTWGFEQNLISDYYWMLFTGFGAYIAYIPFNAILFDRLIAAFKYISNVGFLIYVADAFGYLGSVTVLLYKDFMVAEMSWVQFFSRASYALSILGAIFMLISMIYFTVKSKRHVALNASTAEK